MKPTTYKGIKITTFQTAGYIAAVAVSLTAIAFMVYFGLGYPLKSHAMEFVVADLRDPASAQFRNVKVNATKALTTDTVCGEINGKNGLGAYTGFQRFIYNGPSEKHKIRESVTMEHAVNELAGDTKMFEALWNLYCKPIY